MAKVLAALLESRSALLADVEASLGTTERLLVRSDLTGTMQLYELGTNRELRQVTDVAEPVATAAYVPGSGRPSSPPTRAATSATSCTSSILPPASPAGSEDLTALTGQPAFGHHFAGISPDGGLVAYVSNKANGVDFDLWVLELKSGEHRLVYACGAWLQASSGFSPDGRFISVLRPGPRPLDDDLLLVEVATGAASLVLAHLDEAATIGSPAWIDATSFYVSSNLGRDLAAVVRYDIATGETTPVPDTGERFDAQPVTSRDGGALVVIENRDGQSRLRLFDPARPSSGIEVPLPEPGVVESYAIAPPAFSQDGSRLYYTLSTPRLAGDVWVFVRATGETRRLTVSPSPIAPDELVNAKIARTESFDKEVIRLFAYLPRTAEAPPPVVVMIHGGPESQSVLAFNPVVQGLVAVRLCRRRPERAWLDRLRQALCQP